MKPVKIDPSRNQSSLPLRTHLHKITYPLPYINNEMGSHLFVMFYLHVAFTYIKPWVLTLVGRYPYTHFIAEETQELWVLAILSKITQLVSAVTSVEQEFLNVTLTVEQRKEEVPSSGWSISGTPLHCPLIRDVIHGLESPRNSGMLTI